MPLKGSRSSLDDRESLIHLNVNSGSRCQADIESLDSPFYRRTRIYEFLFLLVWILKTTWGCSHGTHPFHIHCFCAFLNIGHHDCLFFSLAVFSESRVRFIEIHRYIYIYMIQVEDSRDLYISRRHCNKVNVTLLMQRRESFLRFDVSLFNTVLITNARAAKYSSGCVLWLKWMITMQMSHESTNESKCWVHVI